MLLTLGQVWSSGNFTMFHIIFILITYAALIFVCLPIHEFAHAFAATKLGDSTAKWHGRLSMNPMRHLDPMGTFMMLLCGFGYAKPVPVNSYYFKNPKGGMAITAFAGPLSNLVLAVLSVGIFRLILLAAELQGSMDLETYAMWLNIVSYSQLILIDIFASVNISLAVFNLLPVPPLDGSRIFAAFLPDKWVYTMERYQMYISMALMFLLLTGALSTPLAMLRRGFGFLICGLFGMPNVF